LIKLVEPSGCVRSTGLIQRALHANTRLIQHMRVTRKSFATRFQKSPSGTAFQVSFVSKRVSLVQVSFVVDKLPGAAMRRSK
jgi:hypothetical protein